jgi:hypothetical protein
VHAATAIVGDHDHAGVPHQPRHWQRNSAGSRPSAWHADIDSILLQRGSGTCAARRPSASAHHSRFRSAVAWYRAGPHGLLMRQRPLTTGCSASSRLCSEPLGIPERERAARVQSVPDLRRARVVCSSSWDPHSRSGGRSWPRGRSSLLATGSGSHGVRITACAGQPGPSACCAGTGGCRVGEPNGVVPSHGRSTVRRYCRNEKRCRSARCTQPAPCRRQYRC